MPPVRLSLLTLPLACLLALAACRKEVPTPTVPPAEPTPRVEATSVETPSASDHPQSPATVGAVVGNQDTGGAKSRPAAPTGGDGTAAGGAASAASSGSR